MFRFPSDPDRKKLWLEAIGMTEDDITMHSRICSLHFWNGDPHQVPSLCLGNRFISPKKKGTARAKRAEKRSRLSFSSPELSCVQPVQRKVRTSTPATSELSDDTALSASIGEPLLSDYSVHELPGVSESTSDGTGSSARDLPGASESASDRMTNIVVNSALLARVEALEAENIKLQKQLIKPVHFRLENIVGDDQALRFYTGFESLEVFLAVFEFLGPAVHFLNYWGMRTTSTSRKRCQKLDPKNPFFLTLIRLRLNARVKDLAYRFGISMSSVSKYITTWICFLYQYLKEIEWMPSPEQVRANLPSVFVETTFAIIDASEVFIETPSDLHMQASTWNNYKHHNTAKYLVACSPNGYSFPHCM